MSIDLIAGVIQGANPEAMARIKGKHSARGVDPVSLFEKIFHASFSPRKAKSMEDPVGDPVGDIVSSVISAADPGGRNASIGKLAALEGASEDTDMSATEQETAKKLEKSMLNSLLSQMMPSSPSLYGNGAAGDLVKQFQVDNLAEAAAARESLGLAKTLYGNAKTNHLVSQAQWPYFARTGITPYAA